LQESQDLEQLKFSATRNEEHQENAAPWIQSSARKSAKGLAAPGVTSTPIREQLDSLRRPTVSPLISSALSMNNLMRAGPSTNESPNRHDNSVSPRRQANFTTPRNLHIPRDSESPSRQVNLHTTPRNLHIPSQSRATSSGNQGISNRTLEPRITTSSRSPRILTFDSFCSLTSSVERENLSYFLNLEIYRMLNQTTNVNLK